jgi:hypothetical protein
MDPVLAPSLHRMGAADRSRMETCVLEWGAYVHSARCGGAARDGTASLGALRLKYVYCGLGHWALQSIFCGLLRLI